MATSWFTQTVLPSGVYAVDFGEPPAGYPFTVEEVMQWDDEAITYEIKLARWRMHFHRGDQLMVHRASKVIDWLVMMRPQVLNDPGLFRLRRDWPSN